MRIVLCKKTKLNSMIDVSSIAILQIFLILSYGRKIVRILDCLLKHIKYYWFVVACNYKETKNMTYVVHYIALSWG